MLQITETKLLAITIIHHVLEVYVMLLISQNPLSNLRVLAFSFGSNSSLVNMSAWDRAKNSIRRRNTYNAICAESPLASIEGADAELTLSLFKNSLNYIGLKNRIKTADEKWIEEFLEQGGLDTIVETLSALSRKGFCSLMDAVQQLECVRCIKAIMNRPFGIEYVIMTGDKFVNKLVKGTE